MAEIIRLNKVLRELNISLDRASTSRGFLIIQRSFALYR
jgi:hypothetical protein